MRRRHLPILALCWLLCQAGLVLLAPLAVCCDGGHSAAMTGHHCEEGAPGIRCVCRVSDAVLAAVRLGNGVLPPVFELPYDPVVAAAPQSTASAPIYLDPADTPPPRV